MPAISGCTTTYEPARSPRIALVSGGYYRDGKKYEAILEAVRGNPRAEAEARTYNDLMAWTMGLFLGGIATGTGGVVLAVEAEDRTLDQVGGAMFLTGLAAVLAADVLVTMAPHHAVDAVNIYNDGVDGRRDTPSTGPARPASSPPAR